MNALFLSELFYPHGGGAEYATHQYAQMLAEHDNNVIVVTNKFPEDLATSTNGKVTVYRLPLLKAEAAVKFQMLFNTDIWLSNAFKKLFNWADLVYVPRFWYSAIPIAKSYKKPVLVHLHDYVTVCPLSSLYNFDKSSPCELDGCSQKCIYNYERVFGRNLTSCLASTTLNSTIGRHIKWLICQSDRIICVSKAQRDIIVNNLPQLKEKIAVIYNPMPECKSSPITGHDFGFIGGSNPIKGFNTLPAALAKLTNSPNLTLHATNFAHPPKTQHIGDAEIIYYKRLTPPQMDDFYKKIRTLIFPSLCPEPLPYAIPEAILRGRLVIASNTGGVGELTQGCPSAFLYEPGNSSQLATLIDQPSKLPPDTITDIIDHARIMFTSKFKNAYASEKFIHCCFQLVQSIH
jgi:glycosyltransferase involved in cell wall biosynthesis